MRINKVMFVCLGNICRSPLAHAVFMKIVDNRGLSDSYHVESSGTCAYHVGEKADPRMRETAKQKGVDINHKSRQIFHFDLEEYDYIYAMDRNNYLDLISLTSNKELLKKINMFRDFDPSGQGDVPDPYFGGQKGFDDIFDMVERTCNEILNSLEKGRR